MNASRPAFQIYSLATLALIALAVASVWSGTPAADSDAVLLHKILYIHLPAAVVTFLACAVVFAASLGQLVLHRRAAPWWDRLAGAAGVVAVVACSILLVTGMIWGKQAWGEWWTWSPRLTFSLVLWVLYAGFVGVRPLVPVDRRAQISAVYGIVAFLDVPLVYISVKLLPDVHPSSVPMDGSMKRVLMLCVLAAAMGAGALVAARLLPRRVTSFGTIPRPELAAPSTPPTVAH